ncbi:hypothetical protein Cni_G14214 [Canna indica]|uniref:Uncharacterized protein n=1 Tax=Canna indica TaxID=4628 RepID=A0AAQ3KBL6_9LILI|nr:hypothetical protein Cni_G14214 [Canna indica]
MTSGSLTSILTRLLHHSSRRLPLVCSGRLLSSTPDHPNKEPPPSFPDSASDGSEADAWRENYRKVQNLDFMTATEILSTPPPRKKTFGLDFHLVQLFFVCLPSLAVYLVAQYARYEIRRMEAELEEKKKKEEEEKKAKEAELSKEEEQKAKEAELSKDEEESEADLSKVIARLDALEQTVKEISDEKKRSSSLKISADQQVDKKGIVAFADEKSTTQSQLKPGKHSTVNNREKVSEPAPSAYIAAVDKDKGK